ncbi:MAG TPA: ABC transporter permease [Nitrospirota bacterium]|jgi:lipooligosaccharide transport system permease protein
MDFLRPPEVGRRAFKVWQRNRDAWLKFYKASMVASLGEPILFLLAFGFGLGRFVKTVEGMPYINFLAPGLVIATAMNAASFECTFGSFTRMSTQKSYDAIIVTPVNIEEVAAGDIMWGATKGFISAIVMLPVLVAFGLMSSPWLLLSPALYLLVGLMFASMGLIITAFAPSYDYYAYYFSLVVSPMFFFSGIFFPLSGMPHWVQQLAWFFPLSHAVNVSRALATGNLYWGLLTDVLWMVALTLAAGWIAVKFIKRRLVK